MEWRLVPPHKGSVVDRVLAPHPSAIGPAIRRRGPSHAARAAITQTAVALSAMKRLAHAFKGR
jgi:hypothetical protein